MQTIIMHHGLLLYYNATYALYMGHGTPLKPSRAGCQGCLPSETACMQRAGKKQRQNEEQCKGKKEEIKKKFKWKKVGFLYKFFFFFNILKRIHKESQC